MFLWVTNGRVPAGITCFCRSVSLIHLSFDISKIPVYCFKLIENPVLIEINYIFQITERNQLLFENYNNWIVSVTSRIFHQIILRCTDVYFSFLTGYRYLCCCFQWWADHHGIREKFHFSSKQSDAFFKQFSHLQFNREFTNFATVFENRFSNDCPVVDIAAFIASFNIHFFI